MTGQTKTGRSNQKQRTRTAIVAAARDLAATGAEVTMPAIARAALVSEATAYRYFSDLPSLISEVLIGAWPPPEEALAPIADCADPVERVGFACEFYVRGVLSRQGAVRAMIAGTISRPETSTRRPGIRFGLIDQALMPLEDTLAVVHPEALAQLKRDLAVVVSAEAIFTLTDLCKLTPDEAGASVRQTAQTLTEAAMRRTTG